jgi:hypothetical protein
VQLRCATTTGGGFTLGSGSVTFLPIQTLVTGSAVSVP